MIGAAPTGDATITSEWSTIVLPSLILEDVRYIISQMLKLSHHICQQYAASLAITSINNYEFRLQLIAIVTWHEIGYVIIAVCPCSLTKRALGVAFIIIHD